MTDLNRMLVGLAVNCTTCGRRKKPIGRDAAAAMANGLCDDDCDGYRKDPLPGELWPGEKREDFGYPDWLVEVANIRNERDGLKAQLAERIEMEDLRIAECDRQTAQMRDEMAEARRLLDELVTVYVKDNRAGLGRYVCQRARAFLDTTAPATAKETL